MATKRLTKVVKTQRLVSSQSSPGKMSAWLAGWDCTLACGHVVRRSAAGRCEPPERCFCQECAKKEVA